ncbi:MAG: radical SAM protein [Victivallaceae bacterium]|nr:radical SAM protein [Victivallaceae bacterium]
MIDLSSCSDCPHRCGAARPVVSNPGERTPGVCSSQLEPVVARAGLHFWEEPVISGTRGSGTVFFTGCNLRCLFCQNCEISRGGTGKRISIDRLRDIYGELIAKGAHNINLVSPMHFTRAIVESLDRPLPVPVVYNTNSYELPETLARLEGKVQIYLPDLKYFDDGLARRFSGAPGYFDVATKAIDEMVRQVGPCETGPDGMLRKGVVIRHLVLPGHLSDSEKVLEYVSKRFHGEVMFSMMLQYIPCGVAADGKYPELARKLSLKERRRAERMLLESGIENGFMQSGQAADRKFIPDFDCSGV